MRSLSAVLPAWGGPLLHASSRVPQLPQVKK
jgi:hypothetical protein